MSTIQRLFILPLLICLVSCQMASNRESHRAQALLDEADLLMEAREIDKAKESAREALTRLKSATEKAGTSSTDIDLLKIRAHFTFFMAENLLTLENANIRPRSLVRFPDPGELIGYEEHLTVAKQILKKAARKEDELTIDQRGFIHGMLAAVLRLDSNTLSDADLEYGKAIRIYDKELVELRANPPKLGSNKVTVGLLENQIRSLHMAQAEVQLLAEEWASALSRLEKAMAGPDLDYFAVQFEILTNSAKDAQKAIDESFKSRIGSREDKLIKALDAKRRKKKSARAEFGSYNPYRMQLTQARVQMNDAVNNLIYRMICFHQLNRHKEYEKAREILDMFYPNLTVELESQLERHS